MKRVTFLFLVFVVISFYQKTFAQYPPIGILPMYYNPSFAGSNGNSRIVSNFSYDKDNKHYYTGGGINLSYDKFLPAIRSGVGVLLNGYYYSDNLITYPSQSLYPSIEFIVAPKISIGGKYTISPSMSIMYYKPFGKYGETWLTGSGYLSSKFGILFNTTQYYIGYAVEYIYIHSGLTTAFQLGYTFQKSIDSKFSFTPQLALPIIIDSGIEVYYPSYNLSFRYGSLILGAISQFDYSYPTGFQLGWQNKGWRIISSNDFTDRYFANLTLRYIFNADKKSIHVFE